ncbi:MAG: DNA cytosine methyltransferase [Acidimicrobiales bacterium]
MTIGSLFSGIGGLELGLERAGLGPVIWQAEQNPFRRDVLARHWPDAMRFHRVEDVGHGTSPVDLICGGFPCQDISPAGTRKGITGPKSGLWTEFERVVSELLPSWAVIENNGHRWRAWVPHVRRALHALGYASLPFRLRASDLGAWHQRARIFLVANRKGELGDLASRPGGIRGAAAEAVHATRARIPWAPADADDQGQLQPSWRLAECGRRLGDGSGRPIEPALARSLHGVPNRVDREAALGDAVVPACAEAVGRFVKACCDMSEESPC